MQPNARRRMAAKRKTHQRLRIIAGRAAGIFITSPQGDQTRPMMEKVRSAVFNIIQSEVGHAQHFVGRLAGRDAGLACPLCTGRAVTLII
jgi:Conserved hypothetical protein 95